MQHRKYLEQMNVSLSRILLYGISYPETLVKCGKVVGSTYTRPETLTTADNVSDDYMVNSEQQPCSKLTWLVIQKDFICSRKFVRTLQLIKHNYINKECSCTSHVIHMRLKVLVGLHLGYHQYHRRYSFTVTFIQ